jgi:DNA-binding NtrC family response regulator
MPDFGIFPPDSSPPTVREGLCPGRAAAPKPAPGHRALSIEALLTIRPGSEQRVCVVIASCIEDPGSFAADFTDAALAHGLGVHRRDFLDPSTTPLDVPYAALSSLLSTIPSDASDPRRREARREIRTIEETLGEIPRALRRGAELPRTWESSRRKTTIARALLSRVWTPGRWVILGHIDDADADALDALRITVELAARERHAPTPGRSIRRLALIARGPLASRSSASGSPSPLREFIRRLREIDAVEIVEFDGSNRSALEGKGSRANPIPGLPERRTKHGRPLAERWAELDDSTRWAAEVALTIAPFSSSLELLDALWSADARSRGEAWGNDRARTILDSWIEAGLFRALSGPKGERFEWIDARGAAELDARIDSTTRIARHAAASSYLQRGSLVESRRSSPDLDAAQRPAVELRIAQHLQIANDSRHARAIALRVALWHERSGALSSAARTYTGVIAAPGARLLGDEMAPRDVLRDESALRDGTALQYGAMAGLARCARALSRSAHGHDSARELLSDAGIDPDREYTGAAGRELALLRAELGEFDAARRALESQLRCAESARSNHRSRVARTDPRRSVKSESEEKERRALEEAIAESMARHRRALREVGSDSSLAPSSEAIDRQLEDPSAVATREIVETRLALAEILLDAGDARAAQSRLGPAFDALAVVASGSSIDLRIRAQILLARALEAGGSPDAAAEPLEKAKSSARRARLSGRYLEALIVEAGIAIRRGRYSDAERIFGRAARLANRESATAAEAWLRRQRADALSLLARPAKARRELERALALEVPAGPTTSAADGEIETRARIGELAIQSGDLAEAIAAFESCIARGSRVGDDRGYSRAALGLAEALRLSGQLDRAADYARRAISISASRGPAALALARIHLDRGETDPALRLAEKARSESTRIGDAETASFASSILAEANSRLGNTSAAIAHCDEAESQRGALNPRGARARASLARAGVLLAIGATARAEEELETLRPIVAAGALADTAAAWQLHHARLRTLQGDFPAAISEIRTARRRAARGPFVRVLLESLIAGARLAVRAGEIDRARKELDEAYRVLALGEYRDLVSAYFRALAELESRSRAALGGIDGADPQENADAADAVSSALERATIEARRAGLAPLECELLFARVSESARRGDAIDAERADDSARRIEVELLSQLPNERDRAAYSRLLRGEFPSAAPPRRESRHDERIGSRVEPLGAATITPSSSATSPNTSREDGAREDHGVADSIAMANSAPTSSRSPRDAATDRIVEQARRDVEAALPLEVGPKHEVDTAWLSERSETVRLGDLLLRSTGFARVDLLVVLPGTSILESRAAPEARDRRPLTPGIVEESLMAAVASTTASGHRTLRAEVAPSGDGTSFRGSRPPRRDESSKAPGTERGRERIIVARRSDSGAASIAASFELEPSDTVRDPSAIGAGIDRSHALLEVALGSFEARERARSAESRVRKLEELRSIDEIREIRLREHAHKREFLWASAELELKGLRTQPSQAPREIELIGQSPAIRAVRSLIERLARSSLAVLITGESGTGKEIAARRIHAIGDRRSGSFVSESCGGLTESILDSEWFGHARGAFTGAVGERDGLFVRADRGTLFLDGVESLDTGIQTKLLRVLETGDVRPVGGADSRRVDVRVIATTTMDLIALAAGGRFRDDLYYRLNGFSVRMPPLRERLEDIPLLVTHFCARIAEREGHEPRRFSLRAFRQLATRSFPGNVRELRNLVERIHIVSDREVFDVADLDRIDSIDDGVARARPPLEDVPSFREARDRFEADYLQVLLSRTQGNVSDAARRSGLSRESLYRLRRKLGHPRPDGLREDD